MTFAESLPEVGQQIQIKWGEGDWLNYGTLQHISDVGQTPGVTWLLSSDRYQNSVVRYYDQWDVADLESMDTNNANLGRPTTESES